MVRSRTAVIALWAAIGFAVLLFHDTLLLIFGGSLIAVLLRAVAAPVSHRLRIPIAWGVCVCALCVLAGLALAAMLLGNVVTEQMTMLGDTLPAAFHDAAEQLRATAIGTWIVANVPNASALVPDTMLLLTRATGLVSGALSAVAAVLIIIFVGVAGAIEPELYTNGFVRLFPANYRPRVRNALLEIGRTLKLWLVARIVTMGITALLVTIGLTALRIPLAGALGLLAGALAFIPNIGAFAAAAPAVIVAFVSGPRVALATVAMYVVVHVLDDFIAGPIVERRVVKLPPIVTLVAQILLGIYAGAIGVALAAPLVATALVLVHRLWVEDVADLPQDGMAVGSDEASIV